MFKFKVHEVSGQKILAACDADIRGKTISESPPVRAGEFYGDGEIGEEIAEIWDRYDSVNLLGNRIVELFIRKGIITEKGVRVINGVKHAIIIRV